jgi:hypothetical protein
VEKAACVEIGFCLCNLDFLVCRLNLTLPTDDEELVRVFDRFKEAENAMVCIAEAMRHTERNERAIKHRMTRLGLVLPDEYKWTPEVSHVALESFVVHGWSLLACLTSMSG